MRRHAQQGAKGIDAAVSAQLCDENPRWLKYMECEVLSPNRAAGLRSDSPLG